MKRLWRLKYYENSVPLRIRLVSSLIFPFFDYCAAVLTDLTGQQKIELKRLTNACVRFVFNLRRDEHVSHFYDVLGWLSADDRRIYRWVLPATSVLASILATTRAPRYFLLQDRLPISVPCIMSASLCGTRSSSLSENSRL